ncbi:unnamed protein product [Rotaria sp. Silwood1]|nr:unnamed protein product [Rotaria sp. Silwood1]CAF4743327.1 unnamed protein product [Rotaria sp. Silwood1]CAF4789509.1 unnamed protein product [Rotaria sp. Silwood1]
MSTFQHNQFNGFSPILLSPSSTSNTTITNHNHILLFDNSDQGSVDSDYTSLGSSKFYGNSGSSSSLHHQGRSQSFDELASTTITTTTIPTRHFNGTLNVNKLNNDPLQFVKIHPNHELIERAQEQLTLLESRKRLQENFKLNNNNNNDIINNIKINNLNDDDNTDWSKAVENWRQKREQKRKQSSSTIRTENEPTTSNIEPSLPSPVKNFDVPETKPKLLSTPLPPPPPTNVSPLSVTTNISTGQLFLSNRIESKSPTPPRNRGPGKIHEIFIQKPVEIRGFGFKLDGGPAQNRPIYISTLEDGSPADKAGLCIDDEVISMNDENIQNMTFDQVRKILKDRNLRGSIKMVVKTYEDIIDDNSQTVTIEHSRTPSPQKPVSNLQSNISVPPISTTTSTIIVSSTTPSNVQSPVYTFLPSTAPPPPPPPPPTTSSISTSDTISNIPIQQISSSPLNIFAPKPFRSTASINLDSPRNNETTTGTVEQQSSTVTKSASRGVVNTLLSNPTLISSNIIDSPSSIINNPKPPPPPLTSVDTLLHGSSNSNNNDSPIAQVRTSVEKKMSQLQQELLLGYPHTQTSREQRPINIPIDLTKASLTNSTIKTSSSSSPSFSPSIQQQDSNVNNHNNRTYGVKITPYENTIHYLDSHNQQQSSTSQLSDRTVNELRVNLSSPSTFQQQQTSHQLDEKIPQQRITSKQLHTTLNQAPRKSHYDDHSWITDEQRKLTATLSAPPLSQVSSYNNERNGSSSSNRRITPQTSQHHQDLQMNRQVSNESNTFYYDAHTNESHHYRSRTNQQQQQQQRDFDQSNNRHHRTKHSTKSPIRTTINSNNNRVLSVSGKLRCSRCNDELGQGSAMVIESLGLYYHIECFRCFVCNIPLSSSFEGTDVRVRSNRLHCQNCFSDENGKN